MNKFTSSLYFVTVLSLSLMSSCKSKDDPTPSDATLKVSITGLSNLGDKAVYENWIMVDGSPKTAGVFSVDADGKMSTTEFKVNKANLDKATRYILTIEPVPDPSPDPSSVRLMAGDFSGSKANLSVNHASALNTDFSSAKGRYFLATPTDDDASNEKSGIWWFIPPPPGTPSLTLPTLPSGWAYEGWVVFDGKPVSTGTFTVNNKADNAAKFSGPKSGPPYPGEDFLKNAPDGLTFPTDLSGKMAVISVEPDPDNDPAPFALKPLVNKIPTNAAAGTVYDMTNQSSTNNPKGTATR